jgi:S1-C subfamily serine protease
LVKAIAAIIPVLLHCECEQRQQHAGIEHQMRKVLFVLTRRNHWKLVTSLLAASLIWGLAPTTVSGQSYAGTVHRNDCTRNINARTDALNNKRWESLVSLARQFIGNCLDLYRDSEPEAVALNDIAIGLNQQGKFDEAIPVLGRCVTVKPDAAYCYVELGQAFEGLGRPQDARKVYERAVSIGGYDQLNASAIGFAKRRLADIPPTEERQKSETPRASEQSPSTDSKKFGTGFVVSNQGHMLTNNHVIAGCRALATRDGKPLQVLSRNASSDLALLQADFAPSAIAVFRTGPAPKLGDSVVAFGFPLPGLLSSEGNVSTGILSATSGLQNDVRFVQISAPVQPGNSGGPLFDSSGHVIGVVVAKLDAVKVAEITGDVPQNVNFAVNWAEVRAFLDDAGVPYRKEISQHASTTRSTAAIATKIAVAIECTP